MAGKFSAVLTLLKKGGAVADPAKWKHGQIGTNTLAPVLLSVAALGGFGDAISPEIATTIAAGVIAVVNVVFTIITSKTVGLPNK